MRSLGDQTERLIKDQFDRLLHLYLAPRAAKKRIHMDPDALLDQVTNLEDMKPFPTKVSMSVRAVGPVNGISVSSDDGTVAIASNDDRIGLMDPRTGRIFSEVVIKTDEISDEFIIKIEFIKNSLLMVTTNRRLVMLLYKQSKDSFTEALELIKFLRETSENFKEEEQHLIEDSDENVIYDSDLKKQPQQFGKTKKFESSYDKAEFFFKTLIKEKRGLQIVLEIQFREFIKHCFVHKNKLFVSVVLQNKDGNRRIKILNLKQSTQTSLKLRTKNKIEKTLFHPSKPWLMIVTRIHVFIFDLKAQEVIKKLLSGCKHLTSAKIHPNGDHLLLGSADRKLVWFDLDSGNKPFKKMKLHSETIAGVNFHPNYKHFPLMGSYSQDCKAIVQFAKTDPQNIDDPLIVPLKSLRAHSKMDAMGVTDCQFFHLKHWMITAGQDRFVQFWV